MDDKEVKGVGRHLVVEAEVVNVVVQRMTVAEAVNVHHGTAAWTVTVTVTANVSGVADSDLDWHAECDSCCDCCCCGGGYGGCGGDDGCCRKVSVVAVIVDVVIVVAVDVDWAVVVEDVGMRTHHANATSLAGAVGCDKVVSYIADWN